MYIRCSQQTHDALVVIHTVIAVEYEHVRGQPVLVFVWRLFRGIVGLWDCGVVPGVGWWDGDDDRGGDGRWGRIEPGGREGVREAGNARGMRGKRKEERGR